MDITPYKLEDGAFWANDDRSDDPIPTKLMGQYTGVLVDAPTRVVLDARTTLPAGIYHLGAIKEVSTVSFDRHGIITVMDCAENRLYVARGRDLRVDTEVVEEPPADRDSLPGGNMSTGIPVDLKKVLQLPWKPSKLLYAAMIRGNASNRAPIELRKSDAAYEDPAVAKHQQAELAKRNPQQVWPRPGKPIPTYVKLNDSPILPTVQGVRMSVDRVVDLKKAVTCKLSGSFRLPALPQELVKPDFKDPEAPASEPKPGAIITVTLVITGADDGSVMVVPLRLPSYEKPAAGAAPVFTGHFAIDLLALQGMNRKAQTYFLYAFSGEFMSDPVTFAFVDG